MGVGSIVYLCGGCLAIPLNKIVQLIPTLLYVITAYQRERKAQTNLYMKKILFLVFFFLAYLMPTFSQTRITMKKQNGIYVVPCKVNGLDMEFIFDTGASNVTISLIEALFMIKNNKLSPNDIYGSSYAQLANGSFTENTSILLREIQIGDMKLYNIKAAIVHELGAPLLLGQSAIEKLGRIQLEGNTLIILDKGKGNYNYTDTNTRTNNIDSSNIHPSNSCAVYSYSPILKHPNAKSESIAQADKGFVYIISKYNDKFYKVQLDDKVGYLWIGWIKE